MSRSWRPLLCSVLVCAVAATAQTPPSPAFEVASVRPAAPDADPKTGNWSFPGIGKFTASHLSLTTLIKLAYDVDDLQIAQKPAWLDTNLYDVMAKPEAGVKLSREELRPRLQNLLQQRFHLVVHMETRAVRGYVLVATKGGPHLTPTRAEHFPGWRSNVSPGQMRGVNWTLAQLAKYLTEAEGFPVVDQTRIAGSYDIGFSYNAKPEEESDLPPLNEAMQQATGLMLREQKVPMQVIVIDSAERVPTEN